MIAYPANFPQPSTNLSGDEETPVIRTDLDSGLVEQEGRFSTGVETLRAQWTLSEAELLTFENWYGETLAGGVLVFGLLLPDDGAYSVEPVRFVGGSYDITHKGGLWFNVTATLERLTLRNAPSNRTPPVPQWKRLSIDPAESQELTLSHRNALLTVRPDLGSETTLRIYPPTDEAAYIYFGIDNLGAGETLITSIDVDPLPATVIQDFPGTLPNVNQSFATGAKRKTTRMEMESGHPRQYAGLQTTVKTYQVEWEFSLAQLETFQGFFYVSLKSGSLPFRLTLPVDGFFLPVPVRFVGGKYSEIYVPNDRFKVAATVERIVAQTVIPTTERPFPVFYSPTVNVVANRKVASADAGKFFVLAPAEGQTINLHIYAQEIEFGILNKGLGNVLITRLPFVVDLGTIGDGAGGVFSPPSFDFRSTIIDLGEMTGDGGVGDFLKPGFELKSTIVDIGEAPGDSGQAVFTKPTLERLEVLVDLAELSPDAAQATFTKPTIELVIP